MLLVVWMGCTTGGSSSDATPPAPTGPTSAVPADLVAHTWQVRLAPDAAREPFEGRQGWIAYFQGDRAAALDAFVAEGDKAAIARLHAEYAAIYRQAALLAAQATAQVYGADAQPTDPKETSYLLGVSGALLGDADLRGKLGAVGSSKVKALAAADTAWKKWADQGAKWPPDAPSATAPSSLAGAVAGKRPDAGTLPHYQLPEQDEGGLLVDAGDPAALWALSRWHESTAIAASNDTTGAVSALLDPWRLPPELAVDATAGSTAAPTTTTAAGASPGVEAGAFPDTFLFMSAASTAGDVAFLSDLARKGPAAVAAHQSDSPYAVIASKCTAAGPPPGATGSTATSHMDVDCVLDQSAALGEAVEAAMGTAAGKVDSFHRAFAEFSRVGSLRAADRAAAALGDTDASARLRVLALDRTTGNARDPLFLLSVAAWDAGNRNSVRAEELVHGLLTEIPGLEAARLPLDALHIRLSRNAAPGRPMH